MNEINNNRLSLRIPSIKSNNEIQPFDQKGNKQKRKITTGKIENHIIKVSYGSSTVKIPGDKKEREEEIEIVNKDKDKGKNNININSDFNLKLKYSNCRATLKDNQNLIKSEINNVKTEENKVDKSTINNDNNKDKKLKEIKAKSNHTLYF